MRLAIALLLCSSVACSDSHGHGLRDAAPPQGEPAAIDAAVGDAAPADRDAALDAGAGNDAMVPADAMPPPQDGGADAGSAWPDRAALIGTLDELAAAACQVELDVDGDGTIDTRWGFEYEDGKLARTLIGYGPDSSRGVEAIVHGEDEREWARCDAFDCELVRYRNEPRFDLDELCAMPSDCHQRVELLEGYEVERAKYATLDEDAPKFVIIERFDAQGRLRQHVSIDFEYIAGSPYLSIETFDERGRLFARDEGSCSSCDSNLTLTYHESGALAQGSYRGDPDTGEFTCDDQGWELEASFCTDPPADCEYFTTEYTRDAQGAITSSHTEYEQGDPFDDDEPFSASFTTDWLWNASGTAAALTSSDELGAWTHEHVVVLEAPEPEVVHSGSHEDRIEIDFDADGVIDAVHTLHYVETAECDQRRTPDLAELGVRLPRANTRNCASPVPHDLAQLYEPAAP